MSDAHRKNWEANILIVDDLILNLRVLAALLRSKNYKVRKAIDGKSAIAAVKSTPPDLILLDIRMPDIDGYEVCRRLREDDRAKDIPIIFISGLNDSLEKAKAFEVGGSDYVTKPFQAEEILTRINNQLTIRRQEQLLRQANAELQEQRTFLRTVIDSDPNFIFVKDSEGRFLLANKSLADCYGTTVEEMLGKTDGDFNPNPEEVAQFRASDLEAIATGRVQIPIAKILSSTGKIQYLQTVKTLLATPSQNPQVLGVVMDVSGLKAAQLALQESEAKNRAILAAIPDRMFRIAVEALSLDDRKGTEPEKSSLIISKLQVQRLVPEETTEGEIFELFPADIEERQLHAIQEALTTGKLQVYEREIEDEDAVRYEDVRIVQSGENEVLMMVRDISDKKQVELALRLERQQSDRLLLNILPHSIADRLKVTKDAIAKQHESASILFADIVGFTPLSSQIPPAELVKLLDRIFSTFDEFAEAYGLEKIKTIGDAYMVAGGLPEPRPDHLEAIADMALAMQAAIPEFQSETLARLMGDRPLQIRIGIGTGAVVAGVIGQKKFIYDLWGDTVNIASRMESHGEPGNIHVTAEVYEGLRDRYNFKERGQIAIKGRGQMTTYWLTSKKKQLQGREITTPLSRDEEEMIYPSRGELQSLYQAALIGDIRAIEAETRRIQQSNSNYRVFCQRIFALAEEFSDGEILSLIDNH